MNVTWLLLDTYKKKKLGEVTFVQTCVSHEGIKEDYYYMYSVVYITI